VGFACGPAAGCGAATACDVDLLSAALFEGAPAGSFAPVSGLPLAPSNFVSVFASTPSDLAPVSGFGPASSDFVSVFTSTPDGFAPVSGLAAVTGGFASAFGSMFGFAFMPDGFAAIDGFASAGLISVFVDEGGVPPPGFAIVSPVGASYRGELGCSH